VKQGRERKDIELPHHQHEDDTLKDGDLGISKVVPDGHKPSAERDRNPHQDEIAEQCHGDVLGPDPFQLCGGHICPLGVTLIEKGLIRPTKANSGA
jgi:hypothetical protein